MTQLRLTERSQRRESVQLPEFGVTLALALMLLLVVTVVPDRVGVSVAVAGAGVASCIALVLAPQPALSLIVIAVYLGCLDGPIKLTSGSSESATLVRDVLLVAAVVGIYVRATVSRTAFPRVPYARYVGLLALVVIAMMFHPGTPGVRGAVAGLRQQLEFLPLMILAALVVGRRRLWGVLVSVLAFIALANTIAAAVQFDLTPEQFAAWGPGYQDLILGQDGFTGAGRTYATDGGLRVRPFGLGGDFGASGTFGWIVLPFAIAWLATHRGRVRMLGGATFAIGLLGILLSQSRGVVLAGAVAVAAFLVLQSRTAKAGRSLLIAVSVGLLATGLTNVFKENSRSDALTRLESVVPGKAKDTIVEDRGSSIAAGPGYAVSYPFGVGMGRAGPGAGFAGDPSPLDAETEFNFLIGEIGTIGLLVFAAFWLRVLADAVRLARRSSDEEERLMFCAVAATLVGLTAVWFQSAPSVSAATAPLFWCLAGIVGVASQRAPGGVLAGPAQMSGLTADRS